MRNVWIIAARECRDAWRDGRFRWAAALLTVVLVAATWTGWAQTEDTRRLHQQAQAAERELSLDKGEMNPHAAAHYGAFVFKPVEPLAAVDPGITPFVGVTLFLEAHQQHLARHRPAADQTAAARLGELSLAGALQTLVPLLIVTLAYAALAGERERGTLRLLASLGVTRRSLVVGKLVGCLIPLAVVLIPAASFAAALMIYAEPNDADLIVRMSAFATLYLVYCGLWVAIALAVSAFARSSGSALVALLAIWFVTCLLAPPVIAAIASWRHPSPTAAEFAVAVQEAQDALPSWPDRVAQVEERFLSGALPLTPDMPSNPEIVALVDAERDESALYERLFAELNDAYTRQSRLYERLGWFMPTVAVRSLSMTLAGTDDDFHWRFLAAAATYRERFLTMLNDELVAYTEANTFDYTRGRELWERIPEFRFEPLDAWRTLGQRQGSVMSLSLWCLLAASGLAWAVARMPVG
jgi:ABC-2 type transport system permease protein